MGKLMIGTQRVSKAIGGQIQDSVGKCKIGLHNDIVLPDSYKRLEYIQSTGTQYINTDYAMTTNSGSIHCEYYPTESTSSTTIWGAQSTSDNSWVMNQYNNKWWIGNTGSLFANSQGTYFHIADWTFSNGSISGTVNEYSYSGTYSGTVVSNAKIALFAAIQGSSVIRLSKVKIYRFVLTDNGVLVRDLIPALRKSDSKPGLYDVANDVFYTNQGTGEFSYQDFTYIDTSISFCKLFCNITLPNEYVQ